MPEPLPIAYLNGALLPLSEARISPLDRGFLFADGVYEVIPVYGGKLFRLTEHLQRLSNSLRAIQLSDPHTPAEWRALLQELVARNGSGDQAVYLQVTRGADSKRDHAIPAGLTPTVFALCQPLPAPNPEVLAQGVAAITLEDTRWARCDIKSVALLANILLKQQAADAGANECILLRGDQVTEGSATTVFAVLKGVVCTPPASSAILPGVTRNLLLELLRADGIAVCEQSISRAQLRGAEEIWLASTTRELSAVTRLDNAPVGTGKPGPLWQRAHALFQDYKRKLAS